MPDVAFDRFYRYDELTEILQGWAAGASGPLPRSRASAVVRGPGHLARDGHELRDRLRPRQARASWSRRTSTRIEVTGCTAALHLIDKLLRGYGSDPKVTRCLDTRVFYVVPRLNPDGAELALADRPRFVRSSVRPYPRLDEQDGLYEEDIDGDGRILMMRMRGSERRVEGAPGRRRG